MSEALVIRDLHFERHLEKLLRDCGTIKMSRYQVESCILSGNPRNRFWGLGNSLDGILADSDIKYEEDINGDYIFRQSRVQS